MVKYHQNDQLMPDFQSQTCNFSRTLSVSIKFRHSTDQIRLNLVTSLTILRNFWLFPNLYEHLSLSEGIIAWGSFLSTNIYPSPREFREYPSNSFKSWLSPKGMSSAVFRHHNNPLPFLISRILESWAADLIFITKLQPDPSCFHMGQPRKNWSRSPPVGLCFSLWTNSRPCSGHRYFSMVSYFIFLILLTMFCWATGCWMIVSNWPAVIWNSSLFVLVKSRVSDFWSGAVALHTPE